MASYLKRLDHDVGRWTRQGLIDGPTGQALLRDAAENDRRSFNFGFILMMMAAVLIAASILAFVAANWEAIPRIARVVLLFALIVAGYLGGTLLRQKGQAAYGEGLLIVGAAGFGGSIALISQMYHLSGDETQAILVWCIGTILAAAALRSPVLTITAVLIAVCWLVARGLDFDPGLEDYLGFPVLAAAIWAVSYWTGSRGARHLLLLSLIFYACRVALDGHSTEVGIVLAVVSALVFAAALWAHDQVERFAQLGGPYPVYPMIGFLTGLGIVQLDIYDQFVPMLLVTLVAFASIVAALILRGRESALMRWVAYAGFTIEVCLTYVVTLGTMMDTAGLFLFSGLVLAAAAALIIRIEKRLRASAIGAHA